MTYTLRPYQIEARYQVNTLLNANRHPVFVSPTGTGKTKTDVSIISDRIKLKQIIYVLTPQEEIFRPWVRDLIEAGLNPGTISDGRVQGASRSVYVCMPMTLVNLLPLIPEAIYPDIIITDECHHSAATTWETIYSFFPNALRHGLTATPRRTDGKPLSHLYTDIVQTITAKQAIDNGFLAKPLPIVPEEMYLDNIDIINGEFDLVQQAEQLGKTKIIGDVIKNYGEVFAGLPVLVACSTFDHAKDMTEKFNNAGWKFGHIHSNLKTHERRKLLRQIETGKLNGLCTVGIGIEGMDIPGLYGLIWLRRTMSLTIYLQFIGRVLRPLKNKEFGIILDPVGNLFLHGWPEADRDWTLEGLDIKDRKDLIDPEIPIMRICPFCGVANASDNNACHFCGKDLNSDEAKQKRKRHLPAMVDGKLIAVESDGQAEEISKRSERIMNEQMEDAKKEKVKASAIEITQDGKAQILRNGLFDEKRRLFREAVKNYL